MEIKDHLILPLDVSTEEEAIALVKTLRGLVGVFKVGLELFVSVGPAIIGRIKETSEAEVFLDLKLNDIPETVSKAIKAALRHEVQFLTIHPDEAKESLSRLEEDLRGRVKILGVTVLTTLNSQKLIPLGYEDGLAKEVGALVLRRAEVLWEAGVDGFVCSGRELHLLRHRFPKALIVVPGIRPIWSVVSMEDQKRIVTPKEAMEKGADYIVVGRPILRAPDPKRAAEMILEEMEEGLSWRSKTCTN